ncbi:hypothetical protein R50072_36450 [Simiduia litorea]|uniref:rhomboid family intramembrane serine protease n=1 Tax=Simiduia litorea TaxID=1435348 RepID=UPI0036F28FB1
MIIIPTEKRFDWRYAPTVMFGIVLLNVLIFFFYQSGDDNKIEQALDIYQQQGFLELEWPAYKTYLASKNTVQADEQLTYTEALFEQQDFGSLAVEIMFDSHFYDHLFNDPYNLIGYNKVETWLDQRAKINASILSLSFLAYGLIPSELSITTLFTTQFLHGDTMHLLGNMFFLVICGFAVEAAIGHWRFLAFYLISGVFASLAHALLDLSSTQPLVGASGAISGVMAMYLAVFKFRKIEFFYWLFIFVGYIRAPALIILPIYIGKELVSFYTDTDSNVAVMAHAGGFVMGALLMFVSQWLSPKSIDVEYIETDQSLDPYQEALAGVFTDIENFRFDSAYKNTQALITQYGENFRNLALLAQLAQLRDPADQQAAMLRLLKVDTQEPTELERQAQLLINSAQPADYLSEEELCKLGSRLCRLDNLKPAETLFDIVQAKYGNMTNSKNNLAILAKKLSIAFAKSNNALKSKHYHGLASKILGSTL